MSEQLDLFGTAVALPPPPQPEPELVALAATLPTDIRFGTASWTFPGWDMVYKLRYPSQRRFVTESLAEYVTFPLFSSVEIDRSYYNPLSRGELRRYADMLPDGFDCAMKVWSEITTAVFPRHPRFGERAGKANPYFLDAQRFVDAVAEPLDDSFSQHIGPLILEIPPAPAGRVEPYFVTKRLARFLSRAPAGFRYAVELRDRRLLTERYFDTLRDFGATHLFNYWSKMPPLAEQLALKGSMPGPFVVIRLVLPPGTEYDEQKQRFEPFDRLVEPRPEMRRDTIAVIEQALERGYPVHVFVNNKVEGSSPLTVVALAKQLRQQLGAR